MSVPLDDTVKHNQQDKYTTGGSMTKASSKPSSQKAYRWNRENYSRQRRYIDIWSFVLLWLTWLWLDKKDWSYRGGVTQEKKNLRRRKQAIWVRETMLELGPTFIKLGQLFSTRADLFPSEYVEELSKLQDKVPAFNYEQVEIIIQEDLGKKVEELYPSFDPVPLACLLYTSPSPRDVP